jgi:restriction endonuclease S subunit
MRKLLLEEANLKAIISLPQGLFVSKGGQGAKTSILYFEKGEPTRNVWFYKITNDGYSMGVNRKEIPGCQIPEALELFAKYAKHGKVPPKTKNSFIIPAEWIKQIDPRLKERIIAETTEQQKIKFSKKREKEVEKLDVQLKNGKITEKEYKEKIWQFDNVVENNIQNEIAKRIEKAHSYSFNLQNYKSILSDDQIKKWQSAFKGVKIKNGANIDARYQELLNADSKTALQILASFNSESSLEMDIAREYLSKTEKKDKKMQELEEILKEAQKYPKVPLSELLINLSEERKSIIDDEKIYFEPTIKTKTNEISVSNESKGEGLKVKKRILLKKGDLVVGLLHTQNGSFAICDQEYVSTGTFVPFEINTNDVDQKYLFHSLRTAFEKLGVEDATGRENYKVDDILSLQIPLPSLENQQEIVEKIEQQKAIIEGADKILNAWVISNDNFIANSYEELGKFTTFVSSGSTPLGGEKNYIKSGVLFIRSQNILKCRCDFNDAVFISEDMNNSMKRTHVKQGDVLLNITGASIGRSAVYKKNLRANVNQHVAIIRSNEAIIPEFLCYLLNSPNLQGQINNLQSGSSRQGLNFDQIKKLKIPNISLKVQKQIIAQLDKETEMLEKIRELKRQAEERLNKILEDVWGE